MAAVSEDFRAFVADLVARGVRFESRSRGVVVAKPRTALTDAEIARLRAEQPALRALLGGEPDDRADASPDAASDVTPSPRTIPLVASEVTAETPGPVVVRYGGSRYRVTQADIRASCAALGDDVLRAYEDGSLPQSEAIEIARLRALSSMEMRSRTLRRRGFAVR